MKKNYILYLFTVLFALTMGNSQIKAQTPNGNGVIYVTASGAGNKSGNSWTNASDDLQMAINAANVQQVWVAGGTYKPKYRADNMSAANANDRNNAFVLKNNVQVYGGFAGTETLLGDRDLNNTANATTLSGDFNGDDAGFTNNGENAYHVVVSSGNNNSAMLNGFTLSGANASSSADILINGNQVYQCSGGGIYLSASSPVLQNLMITRNTVSESGGGIFGYESSPVLSGITMQGNQAKDGGGMANQSQSSPVLSNIIITENEASELGGGLYNVTSSSPVLTNVSIGANTANSGGGIYNADASSKPQIRNSIIYGNNTGIEGNGTPVVSYSLVQGSTDITNGNIDGNTNPDFVDASNGDYSLKNTSPLINKGSNTYFDAGQTPDLNAITTDLAGNTRIIGTAIDLGAYEYQTPLPVTLINFIAKADGNRTKLIWQTAAETNNALFVVYRSSNGTDFIAIDQKAGLGTSATGGNYLLYDSSPLNGTSYYKLVQVDNDGKETDLGIRSLNFSLSAFSPQLYPNPTKDKIYLDTDANDTYTLLNSVGQKLRTGNATALRNGLDVSELPAGLYLITIAQKTYKFLKR
ncbi:T9SS type A sorting domain-containing protein [Pedobacter sp. UBA4863]|uniref:T9SS type A sorting domain-containing protein n=1 Tax=Pedobacter sp. UBA4863 TaxID=1947060 RepID=UPI0025D952F9|nr:T9SS type A sorting domain-containing protein [Pedobacter sp. UBA4863]